MRRAAVKGHQRWTGASCHRKVPQVIPGFDSLLLSSCRVPNLRVRRRRLSRPLHLLGVSGRACSTPWTVPRALSSGAGQSGAGPS